MAKKAAKKDKQVEVDICNRCGKEYYDILGIGCCPECFINKPTQAIDKTLNK